MVVVIGYYFYRYSNDWTLLAYRHLVKRVGHLNGSPVCSRLASIFFAWLLLGALLSISVLHRWQLRRLTGPCLLFWLRANCSTESRQWHTLKIFFWNLSPVETTSNFSISLFRTDHVSSRPINHTITTSSWNSFNKPTEFLEKLVVIFSRPSFSCKYPFPLIHTAQLSNIARYF